MKRFIEGLSKELIGGLIALMVLLAPVFAIGYYQRSKDLEERLLKACESYASIIDTLRNETFEESVSRLRKPTAWKLEGSMEHRVQAALQKDSSEISEACNSVYGLTSTFPTYQEYIAGYKKYLDDYKKYLDDYKK